MNDECAAWRSAALDLPQFHSSIAAGQAQLVVDRIGELPELPEWLDLPKLPGLPASLDSPGSAASVSLSGSHGEGLRTHVLDVLMVEAFTRRHADLFDPDLLARIGRAAHSAADRLGMRPIISYPLYIRANPMSPDKMRRFTPLAAEARFIRMHRFIEDRFDEIIRRLSAITNDPDTGLAFADYLTDLGAAFRRINRVMSGFRNSERIPNHDFVNGFRPYFDAVRDPSTGEVLLDGPSGLQSPTFRIIAMLTGYQDPVLDDWTRRIAEYHDPETRLQLRNALGARDAGRSLGRNVNLVLENDYDSNLPHLHPDYAAHIPALFKLAVHGGYLSPDVVSVFEAHDIDLGSWPAAPAAPLAVEKTFQSLELTDPQLCALGPYVELESMLFGFHVEHVAVAADQIGHDRGTGGTSGVEFLMLALFRRAFPSLWVSGAAQRIVDRATG